MVSLAVAFLSLQTGPVKVPIKGPVVGPLLPAGSTQEFQATAIQVQRQLSAGDFASAATTAKLLPASTVSFHVDWASFPNLTKVSAKAAFSQALEHCRGRFPAMKFIESKTAPNIAFSFSKDLGRDPDTGQPRIAAILTSNTAGKPRIESVLRLARADQSPLDATALYNEVLFATATYLGVAEETQVQSATQRIPGQNQVRHQFLGPGLSIARRNLVIAAELRKYVAEKVKVIPAIASLVIEPTKVNLGDVVQGTIVPGSVAVTNNGNTDLQIRIVPDCGCFKFDYANTIPPGKTQIARFTADSTAFAGKFRKKLTFVTNDPERPSVVVPVEMNIDPVYRFLRPNGAPVEIVPDAGLVQEVFLAFGEKSRFKIKSIQVNGATAQASFEEWKGSLPDPELAESSRPREGYKVQLLVSPSVTGRMPLSLIVETDYPQFETLVYTFQVQRGIVALPQSLYFGEIVSPAQVPFTVSRPGKPFRIKRISSDNKSVTLGAIPTASQAEFKLIARLNPGLSPGRISAVLTVETDDPRQPLIYVPVTAFRK